MKQKFLVILLIMILLIAALFIYWWALAPSFSRLFISEDCIYNGVEYFYKDTYLQFENGKDFQKMLYEYSINKQREIIDFYYVDNYVEDNPIYGKMCDIYALDVAFSQDEYIHLKHEISLKADRFQSRGDYISYALPYDPSLGEIVRVISFCDKANVIRYIIITEFDTTDDFDRVFAMHTNLDWKTGDGSLS